MLMMPTRPLIAVFPKSHTVIGKGIDVCATTRDAAVFTAWKAFESCPSPYILKAAKD
jgi:hypothetical protein